ncbi:MAG: acylphosphatase [Sphingobacteriales bacterium]|nr:MAG: acylphosphatase [Sphingobacteriales bacterium]
MKTISITVKGKVQGVYFRHFTKTKADTIGITGTVKNLSNGDVFIVATGEEYQLNDLLLYCKQGPPRAVVTELIKEDVPLQQFNGFEVMH